MNSLDLTQSNFISVTANGKPVHKYMGNDSPSDIVTMVMKGSSADIVFDSNTGNLGSGVEIPGRGFNLTYKVIGIIKFFTNCNKVNMHIYKNFQDLNNHKKFK